MTHFLHLTFLYCLLTLFSSDPVLECTQSTPKQDLQFITANMLGSNDVKSETTNLILQSKDGGQTWHDISKSLPENEQPEGFFAGDSDVYLRLKNVMYRSKSNLETPVWEKENALDPRSTSIAFNPSGINAYNYEGQIYQKNLNTGIWMPIHTNFKRQWVRTIFESSNGTIFLGCDSGIYKSADQGQSWKQVLKEVWVMEIVESEGVLLGTSQDGIIRSTDNGEHWDVVIRGGGVGIAVERIDGGFAAISYSSMTQSRRIRISLDGGKTWKAIDEGLQSSASISSISGLPLSASISSIKQMGEYLICGHPEGIFRSSDMGNTWNIVHPGVDEKVFKIYASGNILFAVQRGLGC